MKAQRWTCASCGTIVFGSTPTKETLTELQIANARLDKLIRACLARKVDQEWPVIGGGHTLIGPRGDKAP